MITMIFAFMMILVFGKLGIMALKFTWNFTKVLTYLFFLPLIIVCIAFAGLIKIAIPVLIVVGIITLMRRNETV